MRIKAKEADFEITASSSSDTKIERTFLKEFSNENEWVQAEIYPSGGLLPEFKNLKDYWPVQIREKWLAIFDA
jgi:hypothetical protein